MSLFLDLPDDLVFNFIFLFIGDVKDLLNLRIVSKSFREKVEILLPVIVELDLTELERIKADEYYAKNIKELETFLDIKKMLEFRLKRMNFNKELDEFDYCIGQGLIFLARNIETEVTVDVLESFLYETMNEELKNVFLFENSLAVVKKAEEECLIALSININISDNQRKLLNWLTGALKLNQYINSIQPHFNHVINLNTKAIFFESRVIKISRFFGFSL